MKKLFTQYPVAAWSITIGIIALIVYAISRLMKNKNNGSASRTKEDYAEYQIKRQAATPISSVIVSSGTVGTPGGVGARVGGGAGVAK